MKAAPSPLQLSFASGSKPVSMATDAFDLDEEPYSPAYSSFSSDESSDDSDLESRATPSDYDSSQQHPTSRSFICPILTPKHCDLLYSSRGLEKCTNRIAQMLGRETPALEVSPLYLCHPVRNSLIAQMQPHYDENSEIRRQRLIAWLNHVSDRIFTVQTVLAHSLCETGRPVVY